MRKYYKALIASTVVVVTLLIAGIVAARSKSEVIRYDSNAVIPQSNIAITAYPSYARDIQPIFNESCVTCHGPANANNGLRLDSYDGVMKGTRLGTVIIPEKPEMSPLIALIRHESDPKIWMPYHKEQLSPNAIRNIENWVRYGARNN